MLTKHCIGHFFLQSTSFIQVQVAQFFGRSDTESNFIIVVNDPSTLAVLDMTNIVTRVAGASHVRYECRQLITETQ